MGIGKLLISALVLVLGTSAYASEAKRYLVKFKSPETHAKLSHKLNGIQAASISSQGATLKVLNTQAILTQALDNIQLMVVESSDAASIEALRNNPAVAFIEEEVFHPLPQPMATHSRSLSNVVDKSSNIPMPWGITAVKAPEAWNTTRGAGARVAVLDTGLDQTHPALISRTDKVRNFTGGNADDVKDDVGHGTHVAGTVLADGLNGGLVGVAPEAKLLMGKVCGSNGCSSIAIASGINWGVSEKVNVISMSLGGFFITSGEIQALKAAEAAGITVVAASGNGGTPNVSYPAAYETCVAVGALDSSLHKTDFSQWGPELDVVAPGADVLSAVPVGTGRESRATLDFDDGKGSNEVKSMTMVGSPVMNIQNMDIVFAGLGKPGDFTGVNVSGKLALISRGEITFADKAKNAIAAGAAGVLIFNNTTGLLQGALTEDGSEIAIPVAMIEQTVGEEVKTALTQSRAVRASLAIEKTDYASFQGTSMATPHVAGVVALIYAANPGITPAQVRELLKNTATALGPNDENQYGSGLVNAEKAVQNASIPSLIRAAN